MVASQLFSQERHNVIERVWGDGYDRERVEVYALVGSVVYIDRMEYYIEEVERMVSILVGMIEASRVRLEPPCHRE